MYGDNDSWACLHEGHEGEWRAAVSVVPGLAPAGAGALRPSRLGACKGAARPPLTPAVQPVRLVRPLAQATGTTSEAGTSEMPHATSQEQGRGGSTWLVIR